MTKSLQFSLFGKLVELDTSDRSVVCFIRLPHSSRITGLKGGSLTSKAHLWRHFKVLLQGELGPALNRTCEPADLTYRPLLELRDMALEFPLIHTPLVLRAGVSAQKRKCYDALQFCCKVSGTRPSPELWIYLT
jgi:hypothetical protein